ncbi:putative transcriptional regulator [Streptacidiphilus sp. MAP12-16]
MAMIGPQRRHPGELEAGVLAVLWAGNRGLTPGDIQHALGGDLARTTVNTILSRLYEKGVVVRTRVGRAFAYAPAQEAQDAPGLAARRMRSELEKEEDRQTVLARFVSGLSEDDEQLLRSLLSEGQGGADGDGAADLDGAGEAR